MGVVIIPGLTLAATTQDHVCTMSIQVVGTNPPHRASGGIATE
jgi:hypothetical protein